VPDVPHWDFDLSGGHDGGGAVALLLLGRPLRGGSQDGLAYRIC
jgi:hypothetical protein